MIAIESRQRIEATARKAAETRDDYCEYPHGSEHRAIWVDAYVAALDLQDAAKRQQIHIAPVRTYTGLLDFDAATIAVAASLSGMY